MVTARKAPAKQVGTTMAAAPVSTELAEFKYIQGSIPTVAEVSAAIKGGYKLAVEDSEGASILPSILDNASSPDQLFLTPELEKTKEHLDETLTIFSVDGCNNSDFDEGKLGIYLVVTVANEEGEVFRMAVGTEQPLGLILALREMDAFPWRVAFVLADKKTKRGFTPVNLESRTSLDKHGNKLDF